MPGKNVEKRDNQTLCCSFCGKSQKEVKKLIAGPTVYICDECIGLCNDIIAEEIDREEAKDTKLRIPRPSEINSRVPLEHSPPEPRRRTAWQQIRLHQLAAPAIAFSRLHVR